MAVTNAQRQRAYRERHLKGDGDKDRINMLVSVSTKCRLERLARHYGVTQTKILEQLLEQADTRLADTLAATPEKLTAYYDGVSA